MEKSKKEEKEEMMIFIMHNFEATSKACTIERFHHKDFEQTRRRNNFISCNLFYICAMQCT